MKFLRTHTACKHPDSRCPPGRYKRIALWDHRTALWARLRAALVQVSGQKMLASKTFMQFRKFYLRVSELS